MTTEIQNRHESFEPGDLTALVCVDQVDVQRTVIEQLAALGYKMHTGLFAEDISLKLKAHTYDVVVVYEHFNDTDVENNPVLVEATNVLQACRRRMFVVLIGPGMVTNDQMQAFAHSVDLAFSVSDVVNLKPVLRRGAAQQKEFYRVFHEAVKALEAF